MLSLSVVAGVTLEKFWNFGGDSWGSCWGQLLVVRVLFSWEGFIKDWVVEIWGEEEEGGLGT